MTPVLIYGLVFVATLLIVDTVLRGILNRRRSGADVKNRLQMLKQRQDAEAAYSEFLNRRGLAREGKTRFRWGFLSKVYSQSGMDVPFGRRIAYVILFFILGWFIAAIFVSPITIVQLIFATLFGLGLSFFIVWRRRSKRIKLFVSQLPQAIDTIVRSIKAGHPVPAAIALVAREMPDPIGSEFGVLRDQLTFGSEFEDAMLNMIDRVGAEELNLLAVTFTVQRGTGGNLSEILENLAKMIRDRLMMKAKIRAISAEGRITAMIMSVFPFGLYLMIKTLVPDYFDNVWETGYGGLIVTICMILMAFGIFVLNRLVNFDY
jgi:tight adherence protein B